MSGRDARSAPRGKALPGLGRVAFALVMLSSGCVGYLIGWSDAEVERLRRIVAELEAKNAELVEENLRLRPAAGRPPTPAETGGERKGPEGDSTCQN